METTSDDKQFPSILVLLNFIRRAGACTYVPDNRTKHSREISQHSIDLIRDHLISRFGMELNVSNRV
jgi:hypothetical protein